MTTSNLVKRGSAYHARLYVPEDLAGIFGRTEIHRSLRTSNIKEANALIRTLRSQAEANFNAIRHRMLLGMPHEEAVTAAQAFYVSQLPRTRQPRPLDRTSDSSLGSNFAVASGLVRVIEAFIADRRSNWEPKTLLMHSATLRLFAEIVGDRAIDTITRADCRRFRDVLTQLPPNMSKRFRGQGIEQVLAQRPTPMSSKNANKGLSVVSALFNWATREGLITESPARALTVPINRRADSERDVFSHDDLRRLFAALDSPDQGARYWLPRIALYSGARLEEIAQLEVADLRQEQGIWCFDINSRGDKKLKTANSERLVPLHSALLRLGLVEYRNRTSEISEKRLWPDLKRGNDGFLSSPFSKWFGRMKKSVGLINPKLTFHSFRHTFVNAMKQAGVEEIAIREIVGHKLDSITMSRYGKRLIPSRLLQAIEKIDFEKRDALAERVAASNHAIKQSSERPETLLRLPGQAD